jgi:hypothetical protein
MISWHSWIQIAQPFNACIFFDLLCLCGIRKGTILEHQLPTHAKAYCPGVSYWALQVCCIASPHGHGVNQS